MNEELIIEKLKTIYDPEIPVNIYDLGLIYEVKIEDDKAFILMTLTTATCPAAAFMPEEVKNALYEIRGLRQVEVEITYEPRWTRDKMSEAAKQMLGYAS